MKNSQQQNNGLERMKCSKCNDTTFIPTETGFKRCECYKIEFTKKQWARFGIDPDSFRTISEYHTDNKLRVEAKRKSIDYCKEFKNLGNEFNMCFMGQSGSGKTHLSIAIGGYLLKKGDCTDICYMPYVEVMKTLKSLATEEHLYKNEVEKYLTAELLIIDDLFKDKTKNGKLIGELKETDIKHIYPIINHRYINNLPTIFSTECLPLMLFELDEALGGRILEKSRKVIFEYGHKNNYRMKEYI